VNHESICRDSRPAACIFITTKAHSYSITTDEITFYSLYTAPSETLTFDTLADGVAYTEASLPHPSIRAEYSGGRYSVKESGFSANWLFRSSNYGVTYWLAVEWGEYQGERYIRSDWEGPYPDDYFNRLSILTLSDASPIVLYTEPNHKGFLGIIPDSPQDTHYLLPLTQVPRIYEMQSGFIPVPEPSTLLLLFGGGIFFLVYGMKFFPSP